MSATPTGDLSLPSRWSSLRQRNGNLGIRGKLFIAFGAVAAATVAASAVAMLSYLAIQTRLTAITRGDLPAMTQAQHLAVQTATLAAATLDLDAAATQDQRTAQLARLNDMANALLQQVDSVEALVGKGAKVNDLRSLALAVVNDVEAQNKAVQLRIDTHTQRVATTSEFHELHANFLRTVAPEIAEAKEAVRSSGNGLSIRLHAFLELSSQVNLIAGAVAEASDADSPDHIAALRTRLEASVSEMNTGLANLPDAITSDPAVVTARGLAAFNQGKSDVFALRRKELDAASDSVARLRNNRELAAKMTQVVDELVQETQGQTEQASSEATQALAAGRDRLAVITLAAIVITVLTGWLYVGRRIAGRLSVLAEAMRSIAAGDLETRIPSGGHDEISAMATALAVFRDNTREVEAARGQAEEARHRAAAERRQAMLELADALEASVKQVAEAVSATAEQMHGTAGGMARTADEASNEAGSVAAAAEEASTNVQTVSHRGRGAVELD